MTPSRLVLFLAACLLPFTCCRGAALVTPEAATARALTEWTRMCAESNGGQLPGSWGEYRNLLKLSLDDVFATTLPTKRYAILDTPIKLPPPLAGDLLIINRSPIYDATPAQNLLGPSYDLKGPGRYLIYRGTDGHFENSWATEDYIKTAFAAAKTALPEPDHEPEGSWVTQTRSGQTRFWCIAGVVTVLISALGYALMRASRAVSLPSAI